MPVRILARQSWLAGTTRSRGGYGGTPRTARQVDVERCGGNARGIGNSIPAGALPDGTDLKAMRQDYVFPKGSSETSYWMYVHTYIEGMFDNWKIIRTMHDAIIIIIQNNSKHWFLRRRVVCAMVITESNFLSFPLCGKKSRLFIVSSVETVGRYERTSRTSFSTFLRLRRWTIFKYFTIILLYG